MSQPSNTDLQTPFDPTGYTTLTGAQLEQLVGGSMPFTDKGFNVITTDDISNNPQVPNANTTTKWQNFIWLRQSINAKIAYVWNSAAASDVVYLQWQTVAQSSITNIQGYQIAANTITDNNIANVSYSKLVGTPVNLPPSGNAGGVLGGQYPNPTIPNGNITGVMIAANAITGGVSNQLGVGANGATLANNIAIPASSTFGTPVGSSAGVPLANDRVVVGAGATGYSTVRKVLDALVEPVGGNANQLVQVNNSGTGFQYSGSVPNSSGFGRILQQVLIADTTVQGGSLATAITNLPVSGSTATLITSLSNNFTPVSATSTIMIEVILTLSISTTAANHVVGSLYVSAGSGSSTAALAAAATYSPIAAVLYQVAFCYTTAAGSTAARTYQAGFGCTNGSTTYNALYNGSPVKPFGGTLGTTSSLRITEYI